MDYKLVANQIIASVGGKENIKNYEHCATRMRLILHDDSKISKEQIDALDTISGYFFQSGQHQFIIGTGKVNHVYEAFGQLIPNTQTKGSDFKADVYANLNPLQKIVRILADILIPLIPALVTTGLLMGIRGLLVNLGVEFSDPVLAVFQILTDTAFGFLPVLITYSATKRFGGTPILGIVVGLMMVAPQLPNAWALSSKEVPPLILDLGGLKLNLIGYQGSVLPAIFAGWLVSKSEKTLRSFVPAIVDLIVTPFLTITISFFIVLFMVGPLLHLVEVGATNLVLILVNLDFGIGYIIFGALQQLIVISGLHHAISVIEIQLLADVKVNVIQPITTASMAGQLGAAIAIGTMISNKVKRANAFSAAAPTLFGITEPLLFGVNLQYSYAFLCGMAGGAIGGLATYLLKVAPGGMGITFVPGMLLYTDSFWSLISYLIVIVASFVPAFILARLFVKVND